MKQTKLLLPKLLLVLMLGIVVSGCIRPYQPDIQQGNILNNSDLNQLRYGMTKQEVLYLLGTPMVNHPFDTSRWDYFYSKHNQQKGETSTRQIIAIFDGDNLVALEGDVNLDKAQGLAPSIEDQQHGGTVITKPTQKEKGFLSRLFRSKPKPLKKVSED